MSESRLEPTVKNNYLDMYLRRRACIVDVPVWKESVKWLEERRATATVVSQ